jgi:hypothetical protein
MSQRCARMPTVGAVVFVKVFVNIDEGDMFEDDQFVNYELYTRAKRIFQQEILETHLFQGFGVSVEHRNDSAGLNEAGSLPRGQGEIGEPR